MNIAVGDVVQWGEKNTLGLVERIRVIDSAKLVANFNGKPEEIILNLRGVDGTAAIWAKKISFEKIDERETKEFKSRIKKN